jgi:hypothetical protein
MTAEYQTIDKSMVLKKEKSVGNNCSWDGIWALQFWIMEVEIGWPHIINVP